MFTRTLKFTNTTGSWTNIAEALTQIGGATQKSVADQTKIDELVISNDMISSEPTLSEDSTTITYLITASQYALDVFDGMSETASTMATGSTITRTFTVWTPVGE
jgi:hypothetical protein